MLSVRMTTSSERFPTTAPLIASLPDSPDRPLWSVMIPVYNCAAFLREALRSVLAQDMGAQAMQIQVVDDASTDADVEALVQQIGGSRVEYFRQAENVGSLRNFETCIGRARGHLIHLLHGDDRVRVGFYTTLTQLFQEYPAAGAAFCRYTFINAEGAEIYDLPPVLGKGILDDWLLRIAKQQFIQYAAIAVRRTTYENVGSFYGTEYGEDWEMWVRIARDYPFAYSPEILAEYRVHTESISWKKSRAEGVIPDITQVIERIQLHLPVKDRKRIAAISKKYYAAYGIDVAYEVLQETGNWALAYAQVLRALDMSRHPSIYYRIIKIFINIAKNRVV